MGLPKRKQFKWNLQDKNIIHHIKHNRGLKWESQNGKITLLKDMDRNHLRNCIAKAEREPNYVDLSVLEVLKLEVIYRELIKLKEQYEEKRRLINRSGCTDSV